MEYYWILEILNLKKYYLRKYRLFMIHAMEFLKEFGSSVANHNWYLNIISFLHLGLTKYLQRSTDKYSLEGIFLNVSKKIYRQLNLFDNLKIFNS